jgi:plastocyanin
MLKTMRRTKWIPILIGFMTSLPLQAGDLVVQVVDDGGQVLPDAAVYLVTDQAAESMPSTSYEVEQKDKMFSPFVTVVPAGANVSFPNRDGIGHHVYSFSPAKSFQLPLSEQELTEQIVFESPGIVTVGCNIHDWMVAYIYVVDTPYFAKTDAGGQAVFSDLPAGDYEIHVAHPGMKSVQAVTAMVAAGESGNVNQNMALSIKPRYFWQPEPRMHEEVY